MSWKKKIIDFCNHYNIPINFLAETLNEPKVVPMIRGKAFEFSVYEKLLGILDNEIWKVEKPMLNAQFGQHDEDIRIIHISTNLSIRVECKLAAKGRFKKQSDGSFVIYVQCMRSRTLGDARIAQLAPIIGVTNDVLKIHNDQYVPSDFDLVITSIGNAFYETNKETDMFEWAPNKTGIDFLKNIFQTENENALKDLTYNKMYVSTADNLSIKTNNWHSCTRRNCNNQQNCGFIPNYPKIYYPPYMDNQKLKPTNGWIELDGIEKLLNQFID